MTRRVCPKCRERLVAPFVSCSACPWSEASSSAGVDPDQLRCQFEAEGQRCRYLGIMSPMTRGEGPWYCVGHFHDRWGPASMLTLRQSIAEIQPDADYSAASVLKLTRIAHVQPTDVEAIAERAALQASDAVKAMV